MSDANVENGHAFDALLKALNENRPLALIGAGVSVRAGYPSWGRLLQRLHERAEKEADWTERERVGLQEHDDLPWRAEIYQAQLGAERFQEFLRREFSPEGHRIDRLSCHLIKIGFSHFLTTNYDVALERAHRKILGKDPFVVRWEERNELRSFITSLGNRESNSQQIVYLHGRYDRPETCVLTEQSYIERYIKSEESRKKLFAIFATKRIVFIGFSMTDPDLTHLLREVAASLGDQEGRHFVIMSLKESEEDPHVIRKWTLAKFGVIPLFYPYTVNHSGLEAVMKALSTTDRSKLPQLRVAATATPTIDPEDPQKGKWGGKNFNEDRVLTASVSNAGDGWFDVRLKITSKNPERPLTRPIYFHLHDSFTPQKVAADTVKKTEAILDISSYGAFTVGAEADDGHTKLELDLAHLKKAPKAFKLA